MGSRVWLLGLMSSIQSGSVVPGISLKRSSEEWGSPFGKLGCPGVPPMGLVCQLAGFELAVKVVFFAREAPEPEGPVGHWSLIW